MLTPDQLMTRVPVPPSGFRLKYHDHIMMMGSCFSAHIHEKLSRYKYLVLGNPFGILYNPVSIAVAFERMARLDYYRADELVLSNGLWHSMDHHGSFSGRDPKAVLSMINHFLHQGHEHLRKSTFVGISLGTAKVYTYHETGAVVGNCHKIPAQSFAYTTLSAEDCTTAIGRICQAIQSLSPAAQLLWTVSPVRHLRDGLIENQISKATLLLSLSSWIRSHPDSHYFPAYEILLDELRDYRYYDRDLTHPSPLAIDIIWERFAETYIDLHQRDHHATIEKIKRAMEHRILHNDPEGLRRFAESQLQQIEHLEKLIPETNWDPEQRYFKELMQMGSGQA